jgi:hypothetical protein
MSEAAAVFVFFPEISETKYDTAWRSDQEDHSVGGRVCVTLENMKFPALAVYAQ